MRAYVYLSEHAQAHVCAEGISVWECESVSMRTRGACGLPVLRT